MVRLLILITCISCLLPDAKGQEHINSFQSYFLNSTAQLKKNKVKLVRVKNCLDNVCLEDTYKINGNGNLTEKREYPMSIYWKYEYDSLDRLKTIYDIEFGNEEDTIYSREDFYYTKKGWIDYSIKKYAEWTSNKTDTLPSPIPTTTGNFITKANSKEQITECLRDRINFNCGYDFKGKYTVKYTYLQNGLLNTGKIYDEKNKLIVDIKYEYKFY